MAAYGTDEGFDAWLLDHGYGLPAEAIRLSMLRARGSAYVDGYEVYWTGRRADVMQERAWPRIGATIACVTPVDEGVIPLSVVNASYRAAWLEAETPGILAGKSANSGQRVKRQKVDTIEREFFDDGKAVVGGGPAFIDSVIDGMLRPFICDAKPSAFLWSLGS